MIKNKQAFTLVELLVSISIIAILWMLLLASLEWYRSNARDGARLSELSNIDLQFEMSLFQGLKLQIPDEPITLESDWVIVWYQWYLSEYILNNIWVYGWWKDPLDHAYFTYRINGKKSTFQIMWFMEDSTDMSWIFYKTYAADLSKRQPNTKWKALWILLEQATNKPLQQVKTWVLDLRLDNTQINMYLSNTSKRSWTVNELYWTLETLGLSQNFVDPKECPTWFIPVPWNRDLWQTAFCVAKYEMSYHWLRQTDNTLDWNSYSYKDNWDQWIIVSEQWNSPIAEITQLEAINECKWMWEWYHLITNNEWVTIARNIENQPINWSSGIVWVNYIYNGISNDILMWCDWNWENNLPTANIFWTITWDINCVNQRNKLFLSNGEEIWDFSGNLWEHVNKANTIDWTNYSTLTNPELITNSASRWNWSEVSNDDKLVYWPLVWINSDNWIWRFYQGTWNIFIRGGTASTGLNTWIYSIYLGWNSTSLNRLWGFRCAK